MIVRALCRRVSPQLGSTWSAVCVSVGAFSEVARRCHGERSSAVCAENTVQLPSARERRLPDQFVTTLSLSERNSARKPAWKLCVRS